MRFKKIAIAASITLLLILMFILSGCINIIATYDYKEGKVTTVDFASKDKDLVDMVYEQIDNPDDPFDTTLWELEGSQGTFYSLSVSVGADADLVRWTRAKYDKKKFYVIVKLDQAYTLDEINKLAVTATEIDPTSGFTVFVSGLPFKKVKSIIIAVNGRIYKKFNSISEMQAAHYTGLPVAEWTYLAQAYANDGELWYGLIYEKK